MNCKVQIYILPCSVSQLQYWSKDQNTYKRSPLNITHSANNQVRLSKRLDYEIKKSYALIVIATENGKQAITQLGKIQSSFVMFYP